MFDRAREYAKAGRTDQAISLLETVVKSYKGTRTADEASQALGGPSKTFPSSWIAPRSMPNPPRNRLLLRKLNRPRLWPPSPSRPPATPH